MFWIRRHHKAEIQILYSKQLLFGEEVKGWIDLSGWTAGSCWILRRRLFPSTQHIVFFFSHFQKYSGFSLYGECSIPLLLLSVLIEWCCHSQTKGSECSQQRWKRSPAFCSLSAKLTGATGDRWTLINATLIGALQNAYVSFFCSFFFSSSFHAGLRPGDFTEPDWQHSHCAAEACPEQRSTCEVGFCDRVRIIKSF